MGRTKRTPAGSSTPGALETQNGKPSPHLRAGDRPLSRRRPHHVADGPPEIEILRAVDPHANQSAWGEVLPPRQHGRSVYIVRLAHDPAEVKRVGDATGIFLSPERREILAFVAGCADPAGPKAVAEALKMNYGSVRRSMPEMSNKQRVLRRVRTGYVAAVTPVTPVTGVTRREPDRGGPTKKLPPNVLRFPVTDRTVSDDELPF